MYCSSTPNAYFLLRRISEVAFLLIYANPMNRAHMNIHHSQNPPPSIHQNACRSSSAAWRTCASWRPPSRRSRTSSATSTGRCPTPQIECSAPASHRRGSTPNTPASISTRTGNRWRRSYWRISPAIWSKVLHRRACRIRFIWRSVMCCDRYRRWVVRWGWEGRDARINTLTCPFVDFHDKHRDAQHPLLCVRHVQASAAGEGSQQGGVPSGRQTERHYLRTAQAKGCAKQIID